MDNQPFITVFTSSYNHAKYLPQAIESVLSQTYKNFEYILIDDGSTDNTWRIMQDYAQADPRITTIKMPKQKTKGPVLNRSVTEAVGDYWVWVPADDYIDPTLLQEKAKLSRTHPQSIIYDDFCVVDGNNQPKCTRIAPKMTQKQFEEIVWTKSPIGFTGIWIPIDVLKELPFPDHIKYSEDYYWMVKATIYHIPFISIGKILHTKRDHAECVTKQNYAAVLADVANIRTELQAYKETLS